MRGKFEKGCFGVAIVIFALTLIVLVGPYLDYQMGLFRISQRLQIEATMPALTAHFETVFVPGTPQVDINSFLQSSGATRIKVNQSISNSCESIVYFVGYWPLNRLNFLLCYDQEQRLQSYTLLDED